MTGKIFTESGNIYEDQAKILFDYYQQAAERIVSEEERIEKEINQLEDEKKVLEKKRSKQWAWIFTIILFFIWFIKKNKLTKEIAALDARINEFRKQHKEIFRDYKVSKLGVAYVPVADQIKYENKSFIVDYTGQVEESEVILQMPRRNDLLIETIGKLEHLSTEAPIVEKSEDTEPVATDEYSTSIQELNQHDYLGGLDRSLRTISYCMDDLETSSVTLPLVSENSEYLENLDNYATKLKPKGAPVVQVFDRSKYSDSVEKFQELNKLKDSLSTETEQFEDVLKSLMVTMANSVQAISSLKVASVDKVVFESNKILFDILKSPYNHYSPVLEYEEIDRIRNEKFDYEDNVQNYEPFNLKQSSRMKFDLNNGLWTSEDGNTSNVPFGVHQIYEEIVAPVVQNLMEENRLERLKVYNHIKDQKISYLNKWHQDTDAFYRANRAESADLINLMQESLRGYIAAYNTLISLKKTEESMQSSDAGLDSTVVEAVENSAETLAAFELQSKEFQKTQTDFEDYIERIKEDIDRRAEKYGHIEYYDAKLRDGYSNEMAVAADQVHELDDRRKSLASVNPLFAKTSELPPQPSVEDIAFEHIALNLPAIAANALDELEAELEEPVVEGTPEVAETSEVQEVVETQEVAEEGASAEEVPAEDVAVIAEEPEESEEVEYEDEAGEIAEEEYEEREDEEDYGDEEYDEEYYEDEEYYDEEYAEGEEEEYYDEGEYEEEYYEDEESNN